MTETSIGRTRSSMKKDSLRVESFTDEGWRFLRTRKSQMSGDFSPTAQRIERALSLCRWGTTCDAPG